MASTHGLKGSLEDSGGGWESHPPLGTIQIVPRRGPPVQARCQRPSLCPVSGWIWLWYKLICTRDWLESTQSETPEGSFQAIDVESEVYCRRRSGNFWRMRAATGSDPEWIRPFNFLFCGGASSQLAFDVENSGFGNKSCEGQSVPCVLQDGRFELSRKRVTTGAA